MSQVNFYMTEQDDREFLDMLMRREDTTLLLGRFHPTRNPEPATAVPPFGESLEIQLVHTGLMDPVYLASEGEGDYKGQFLLDAWSAPNIEFARCFFDHDGILQRGRIYAMTGRNRPEEFARAHRNWYNSFDRWIKRRYRKLQYGHRIGPHAFEWISNGGQIFPGLEVLKDED